MKAIVGAKVILKDRIETGKALLFDQRIVGLVEENGIGDAQRIDAGGLYAAPGLVDMHIHGYLGEDVSDGSAEGIRKMARGIAANGVTSWLPTTMTVDSAQLRQVFEMMRGLRSESQTPEAWQGAEILGINAEGPFINPGKKGAQAEEHILPPSPAFIEEYQDIIRVFTLAPEMPGGLETIRRIRLGTDVLVSMGHTGATYEQTLEAIDQGASHVTHLFNAMTPLNHRDPGVVGAALSNRVTCELIADTFHIHPGLFPMIARLKGEQLILITDCTRGGGLPDGEYTLGGQAIFVNGIECRLADGTIAGSVLKLQHAVRNMYRHSGLPLWEVWNMASLYPARTIGAERQKGSLEAGKDADIVLLNEAFEVEKTLVKGTVCYAK